MSQANIDLIRSVAGPWAQGDFSGWIELFADDVVMSASMPEGVVSLEGRGAVLEYIAEIGSNWSEYRVDVEHVASIEQDSVLVTGRQTGIGREGVEIAEPIFVVNLLRDAQIVGTHWRVDRKEALEAAGLSE